MRDRSLLIAIMRLALVAAWPVHAADLSTLRDSNGIPTPFGQQVLEAFHGKDLKGKDGPLHKLGMELIVVDQEFRAFQEQRRQWRTSTAFQPGSSLVHVRNEHIVIDAVATGSADTLSQDLVELGMQQPAVFGRMVSGSMPVRALGKAAGLASLHRARPAMMRTRAGSVTSQGDAAMQADTARSR